MVALDLNRYVDDKDKNGSRIGDWAASAGNGLFVCKVCDPSRKLSFKSGGKFDLFKHSESVKHIKCVNNDDGKTQTVKDLFKLQKLDEVDVKVLELETAFVLAATSHGVPTAVIDCLTETMQKYITDSEIIQRMRLHRTKAHYLTNFGLADKFERDTVTKLKKCIAFSASLDESEVNKTSQLQIVVNIYTTDGLEIGVHYNTLALEAADATTIKTTFLNQLEKDGIDYKSKLIDVSTDGCATMIGVKKGLQTQLTEEIECLHYTGHCRCHDFSNTMQYATEAFKFDAGFSGRLGTLYLKQVLKVITMIVCKIQCSIHPYSVSIVFYCFVFAGLCCISKAVALNQSLMHNPATCTEPAEGAVLSRPSTPTLWPDSPKNSFVGSALAKTTCTMFMLVS